MHVDTRGDGVSREDEGLGAIAVPVPADMHGSNAVVVSCFAICKVSVEGATGPDRRGEGNGLRRTLKERPDTICVSGEAKKCELRAISRNRAHEAAVICVGDVHGGDFVVCRVEEDELETEGNGDGVGGLGGEVPLEDGAADAEGDFGAVCDELVEVGGGEVEDAGGGGGEAPDVAGSV